MLSVFSQIGWLGIALPFDLGAIGIDQRSLHPVPNNFFVVLRKRSAKGGIHILREGAESNKEDYRHGQLHESKKSKMTAIVDEKTLCGIGFQPMITGNIDKMSMPLIAAVEPAPLFEGCGPAIAVPLLFPAASEAPNSFRNRLPAAPVIL